MKVLRKLNFTDGLYARKVDYGDVILSEGLYYLRLQEVGEKKNYLKFAELKTGQVVLFGDEVPCTPVNGKFVEE